MPKNLTFTASEPLTTTQMNLLLQDGQIMSTSGQSENDVMSQKATTNHISQSITTAINGTIANNINSAVATAINGTIANNINSAVSTAINGTIANNINSAVLNAANQITITPKPEFGNATTLQAALNYLANVLNGTNTISKLKSKELDLVD